MGLLLALLFGSMAPARHYRRKAIVNQQAEQFAMRWFTLLQKGSIYTAHQLLMDPKRRIPSSLIPFLKLLFESRFMSWPLAANTVAIPSITRFPLSIMLPAVAVTS